MTNHGPSRRTAIMGLAGSAAIIGGALAATSTKSPIVLIGATAKSAPAIIIEGLAQGRVVTAVSRRPEDAVSALPEDLRRHPRLRSVRGDAYDVNSLAAAMTGTEVVISVIAPRVDPRATEDNTSVDIYSVGTASIIFAMMRKGNRRIIPVSSGGTEMIGETKPPAEERTLSFVWHERGLYQDMTRMEKIVRASGLEFVVPRCRRFVKGPARHDLKIAVETPMPKVMSTLTYADFAAWVLEAADGSAYLGKTVGIYTDQHVPI